MSSSIRFSVIIPAYNAMATLPRAIESCLQQTHMPYEIIVIDDYSTDNTDVVATEYGNKIKYIKMLQNNGSSIARNKGIDAATGDYIAFLDADDLWHEEKLEIMASVISSGQDIFLLYHKYTLENIKGKNIPESTTLYKLPFIKLLQTNPIATPCAIMRNNRQYRFEPSMRYMEDYDLWLRIAHKHAVFFINIELTQINRPVLSKGGVSSNKWQMRKGELKAYRRLIRLNPTYVFLLPILYPYSIGKHLYKIITAIKFT